MYKVWTQAMVILTSWVLVCFVGCGCSTTGELRYTVAVVNDGREGIVVEPFKLADVSEATVAVGQVLPAGRKSMAPYCCRPAPVLDLVWRILRTGEEHRARLHLDLPEAFTPRSGSAIVIHIKPEDGRVEVCFEVLDTLTGQISTVR